MAKKSSLKTLRAKAWKLMSLSVRQGNADHRDQVICVTCGHEFHWKEIHAGHFIHISKQHPLSYDKRNINPQCAQCNYYDHKGIEYTLFMTQKYGLEVIQELMNMKRLPYFKRQELEDLCITLQSKN